MRHAIAWAGMMVLFLLACGPVEETDLYQPGADFFPLRKGAYSIHKVDSTSVYLNVETKFSFMLRLTVVDSFMNGEGSATYVLQRHKQLAANQPWIPAGTHSARLNLRHAIVNEGNTSFVKLQFPISTGTRWDGNALNTLGGDETCDGVSCDRYEVDFWTNEYRLSDGRIVGPAFLIKHSDEAGVIVKKDVRFEWYARDIGLIYKEINVLNYCTQQQCCPVSNSDCLGKQFVTQGIKYVQELVEYGNN